jgi:putative sugar O-methyltransferase
MDFSKELEIALKDLTEQNPLYQPTPFWGRASTEIATSLFAEGVEGFRANRHCLSFFVPNYGAPTSGITIEEQEKLVEGFRYRNPGAAKSTLALHQMLSGQSAALADLRVLQAADDPRRLPFLHNFTESKWGEPVEHHSIDGKRYSRSAFNYLLGLVMLKKYMSREVPSEPWPRTVLEIGGGFGTLGEVLSQSGLADWRYIDIDIPPTATVAEWYLRQAVGDNKVLGYSQTRNIDLLQISNLPPISVLMPWQLPRLQGTIDLFVNFISFQEMEPPVVSNYLRLVSNLAPRWILLRNLKEGKQRRKDLDSVGVDEPILGDDYPAMLPTYALVERSAMPFGYVTVDGFHSELLLFRRV